MKQLPWMLAAAIGCADGDAGGGNTAIDSSGVTVVTSTSPAWQSGIRWEFDRTPDVEVGDASSANSTLLLTVTGARLLEDGRYAVSLNDEKVVRWFDEDGREAGLFGRDGEGPGEFRGISMIGMLGDSLLVWDFRLARATVIAPGGEGSRTFRFSSSDSSTTTRYGFGLSGVFSDGRLLLAGQSGTTTGDRSGYRRDTIPLVLATAAGEVRHLITAVPGNERVAIATEQIVTSRERPFGARTAIAIDGNSVLVSVGDVDEVRRYSADGGLLAIYRLDRARRTIPASDIAIQGDRLRGQVEQLPDGLAEAFAAALMDAGLPSVYPAHDRILVDATGAIWLREDIGGERSDREDRRWTILSPDGRWLGSLTTPMRFAVHQVTDDRVIGIQRDEYGVELFRTHRLNR